VPDQIPEPAVDHRRAIAERNAAAILDATERLLAQNTALSMVAIAAEASVSRPTLYAHFKSISDIVEAAVERSVNASVAAFEAARPDAGPAEAALPRMVAASWGQLARFDALARGAAEHLTPGARHRTHEAMMTPLHALIERGQHDGAFRTDLPADWLVTMFFTLMHGADEHARTHDMPRDGALEMLTRTMSELFAGPGRRRRSSVSNRRAR
jgi:TetR/AcrR family transcriptional regulator, mexCD-oprJ operon repressor